MPIVVLAVIAILVVAVLVRMRATGEPSPARTPARPVSMERRVWEIMRRLPVADRVTIGLLALGGLILIPIVLYLLIATLG